MHDVSQVNVDFSCEIGPKFLHKLALGISTNNPQVRLFRLELVGMFFPLPQNLPSKPNKNSSLLVPMKSSPKATGWWLGHPSEKI